MGAAQAWELGADLLRGCGRRTQEIADVYEREMRHLPCIEDRTTVVVE